VNPVAGIARKQRRRGNGGAVETGENQQQVFAASHNTLEIRQTAPDFHIPTATATVAIPLPKNKKTERKSAAARPPHPDLFQDHVALETLRVSGSSDDWKMLPAQRQIRSM